MADAADKKPRGAVPEKPQPPGYFEGESMTRRTVFGLGVQAVGGVAVGVIALPAVGFALAPIFDNPEERWEGVGSPDEFSSETYRQAVITETAGIGDTGKTTVYIRRGSETLGEDPNEFIAISTRCAHLGCPVRFVKAAGNFICPCHGGVYDFEGKVIGGPPVRPLDRFQTRVEGGRLEVGPRYSVTSQLEPVRARDPGEFTGGIWEYLYPPRPTTAPPP
ncbi:MAG: ubiquinol-cytochrome c reductase iron-sulfur subunit [Solirubrobacterales bacterium]